MNRQKLTKAFIIDDNINAIEVLRRMLESSYSVEVVGVAYDAETAADLIIKTEPDLLFLDVELPTMSSIQVMTNICWMPSDARLSTF